MRVLVVEDESKVARALKQGLEEEHYEVAVAKTGEEGFFRASAETFDLIVLDLMLPGDEAVRDTWVERGSVFRALVGLWRRTGKD
jgi:DNA-binding response OmpR family regulator